jgi:large subunit ribosomal protein L4
MADAQVVKSNDNTVVGTIELPDEIFARKIRVDILHEAVRNYRASQRQGNASTKTRSEVRGGGRKPWRQKGTGRARAGTNTSPLWRKGGIVFGPKPRSYSYKLNKKFKRLALKIAFSAKQADENVIVVDSLNLNNPKTKEMVAILKTLGIDKKSVLILVSEKDELLIRASRNIPLLSLRRVEDVNVYDLLAHEKLLLTQETVEKIKEVYVQ